MTSDFLKFANLLILWLLGRPVTGFTRPGWERGITELG